MKAFVNAISYVLPKQVLDNHMLNAEFPEWQVEKIAQKTGIHERRISSEGVCASDLALLAAERLFEEHDIDRAKVDFLLLCTQSPDYFLPTTACVLQDRLGLSKQVGALDFNLGCSGYIYGLSLAKGLIVAGIAKNVLLITAETYSKYIHPEDKSNRTLFGDAAAATLVSHEGYAEIGQFVLGTDGSGAENLIVRNGALRHPEQNGVDVRTEEGTFERNDDYLYMNGKEIFFFTSKAVPGLLADVLAKNALSKNEISLYVLHQANQYMLETLRKKSGIEAENFYIHLSNCGNTVSSTIPIALYHAQKEGRLQNSAKVALAGFGVGYSWGATVLTY